MIRWKCITQKLEILLLFFQLLHGRYHDPTEINKNSLTDFAAVRTLLVESTWAVFSGRSLGSIWSKMICWCCTSMDPFIFLVNSKERCWATFFSYLFPLSSSICLRWVHWDVVKYSQLKHQHYADHVQSLILFSIAIEIPVPLLMRYSSYKLMLDEVKAALAKALFALCAEDTKSLSHFLS